MFAVLFVPHFQLQALLRLEPENPAQPVALIPHGVPRALVWQMTPAARDAGVVTGMSPTQALARCRTLSIRALAPEQEEEAQSVLLDGAFAFSPYVEATAPGLCTIDLKGFRELDEERFAQQIVQALAFLQFQARVGIAENPLLAAQAARAAQPVLVVRDSRAFLDALPVESLDPAPEILEVLRKWGIRTVAALRQLSGEALAERLGPEALEMLERMQATRSRPLRLATPRETFSESMEFEHEIETAQPLLFALRRFVEQLARRLILRQFLALELTLQLDLTEGEPYRRTFQVPAPTSDTDTLFCMLDTHLETLRTASPIVALHLSAVPCRPPDQQLGLFESTLRNPNQFFETLARLSALLGSARVGTPVSESSHRPDAFHLQALNPRDGGGDHIPELLHTTAQPPIGPGLRRLRPPLAAEVELVETRPAAFRTARFSGRITECQGPWRSSGDWWDREAWSSDEWDVQTTRGELFRLSQRGTEWFLEAIYD